MTPSLCFGEGVIFSTKISIYLQKYPLVHEKNQKNHFFERHSDFGFYRFRRATSTFGYVLRNFSQET